MPLIGVYPITRCQHRAGYALPARREGRFLTLGGCGGYYPPVSSHSARRFMRAASSFAAGQGSDRSKKA